MAFEAFRHVDEDHVAPVIRDCFREGSVEIVRQFVQLGHTRGGDERRVPLPVEEVRITKHDDPAGRGFVDPPHGLAR